MSWSPKACRWSEKTNRILTTPVSDESKNYMIWPFLSLKTLLSDIYSCFTAQKQQKIVVSRFLYIGTFMFS